MQKLNDSMKKDIVDGISGIQKLDAEISQLEGKIDVLENEKNEALEKRNKRNEALKRDMRDNNKIRVKVKNQYFELTQNSTGVSIYNFDVEIDSNSL